MALFWFIFKFRYWKTYQKYLSLFYRIRSCPDSAKNGSDLITDPIIGSALVFFLLFFLLLLQTVAEKLPISTTDILAAIFNIAYLMIEGAIYSHFYAKIEIWSIKLGWGVIHSFTWIYSMEIQIPESKFTPLIMNNVIIFNIFTTFHCKCYFLMDRVWPSKRNISK